MTLSAGTFQWVRDLVRTRSAVMIDEGKETLVEARLLPLAHREGFRDPERFVQSLRSRPAGALHESIVEALTTNETMFFRDPAMFTALRERILPCLLERRAASRSLAIWCAASSTGQEPYSVAMTVAECFPQHGEWSMRILASDISTKVLGRAREGWFEDGDLGRGLPPAQRERWFRAEGGRWRVDETLRRMVEFRRINLAAPWPALPVMDLILMRNVLIYFDVPTRREIFGRVRTLLRRDGCLVLGSGETPIQIDGAFEPHAGIVNGWRIKE
jgi:chemotaxis protein methyltransferase CheR